MEKCKVEIINTCLVSPAKEIEFPIKSIVPSALSHMTWFLPYRTRFLFFNSPLQKFLSFDGIVGNLKDALAKALVGFYPIAGRLIVSEVGNRMELLCNGKGVLFIQASASIALEELAKNEVNGHFVGIPVKLLLDLAQSGDHALKWPWSPDDPLFIIQVTRFSCGGICISVTFNHQILDGTGTWHFVKSWFEICRGKLPSIKPIVMETPRTIALPSSDEKMEIELPPDFALWRNSDLVKEFSATHELDPAAKSQMMRCFSFTKEKISKLKQENPGFTTFQLLTTHIWRSICIARKLTRYESTALFFAVNCRSKVSSIPAGYVGEAAMMARTSTSVGELQENDGLQSGAALVKRKVAECDEEEVNFYCRLVGTHGKFTVMPKLSLDRDVNVGSSFYFPVFEDFGCGKPAGMAILPIIEEGKVYYFPAKTPGDVIAYICLEAKAMDRLVTLLS